MLVFVYGTLKKGYSNHHVLGDSRFVGPATTNVHYKMLDAGFPVLMDPVDGDKAYQVEGEVYEVDRTILADLDRLEGKGRMYDRVRKYVTLNGRAERVNYYVGLPAFWDRQGCMHYYPTEDERLNWPQGKPAFVREAV